MLIDSLLINTICRPRCLFLLRDDRIIVIDCDNARAFQLQDRKSSALNCVERFISVAEFLLYESVCLSVVCMSVCVYVCMYPILSELAKFNSKYDKTFRLTFLDTVLKFSQKLLKFYKVV